jgi:SEC-C motif
MDMGAIAEAFVAYAQPLLDQTDGSKEQLNNAFTLSQLCYNLALLPEHSRDRTLSEMRPALKMDDEEFDAFQRSIVVPMIRRHQEMFPKMHRRVATDLPQSGPSLPAQPRMASPAEKYPGIDRYAPCPCNSGQKYKFCCGKKGR